MFLEVAHHSLGSLQYQGYFWPAPMGVTCLGLLPLRLPVPWACLGGGCLVRAATSEVTDSCLVQRMSLALSCWLGPAPSVVSPLYLLLWRLLFQARSGGCNLLRPVSVDVPGLGQVLQRSLPQACSLNGCSLVSAPLGVAASGMIRRRLLHCHRF